jgi:GalNAc5-diNAcBac-PP-undecaprenol beta-1,3-glucosyltransferase
MISMPSVTVVCPTFDHGPTLQYSLASALDQTVEDIELFVVGDGVPDVTREIVGELAHGDERVRFFANPKGERRGERHRHLAIAEARGRLVLYLSDDDLWLPHHVETLVAALGEADWAHTISAWLLPDGQMGVNIVDLADTFYRDWMFSDDHPPSPGLSQSGHTRTLYDALPAGWNPAPLALPTDVHMWRQILAIDWVRPRSVPAFTAISFPSPPRAGWSAEQRADELGRWAARLAQPDGRRALEAQVLATFAQRAAWEEKHAALKREALEAELRRGSLARALGRWRKRK